MVLDSLRHTRAIALDGGTVPLVLRLPALTCAALGVVAAVPELGRIVMQQRSTIMGRRCAQVGAPCPFGRLQEGHY